MKVELKADGVLYGSLTITHRGKCVTIDNMIVDTGAAESLLSKDSVETLFEQFEPDDIIHWVRGIGGREPAVQRRIDCVHFDTFRTENFRLDLMDLSEYEGMNGLIGLDILLAGNFIIDLKRQEVYCVFR